jgi:tRNA threonylcarbamoyladenosine biosynthesis protein TsaB
VRNRDPVLLAFDTSGAYGSVAVAIGDTLRAGTILPDRAEHASKLVPAIDEVLREAGLQIGDVDGIVVGEGPGSFTGVRVAAATAKGLSGSAGIPLRPVSSLAAAALVAVGEGPSSSPATGTRYALFDARGDRVYGACYRVEERTIEELVAPHAGRIGDVIEGNVPPGTVFTGDGASRHRPLLEDAGYRVVTEARALPLAPGLLRCAALGAAPEVDDPGSWEPRYVRASSAERLWTV